MKRFLTLYCTLYAFSFCLLPAQTLPAQAKEFWQPITTFTRPSDIISPFVRTESALYVSNTAGILRSTDNGATWVPSSLCTFGRNAVAATGRTPSRCRAKTPILYP